ncbi:hypothetical protein KIN20_025689 [Parelaphostrongylus tenuis]|uniref:Uncharacterized protein n=1 Tax=Parelaphostrongylus tenuis TaxID=148309 RepID=A0AAD5MVS2_PARTN|nr:hypothetical protein KIN20_025689 [Parelaphostrongylus tenuis]
MEGLVASRRNKKVTLVRNLNEANPKNERTLADKDIDYRGCVYKIKHWDSFANWQTYSTMEEERSLTTKNSKLSEPISRALPKMP